MGTVCCTRDAPRSDDVKPLELPPLAAPKILAPPPALQVEGVTDAPRKRRTSMGAGRSLEEQRGFEVYIAHPSETLWLNEVVKRLWTYIESSIRKLLLEDVTSKIREECADMPILKSFAFSHCGFGGQRPEFSQMKVRSKGDLLEIFMEIHWNAPESNIEVTLGSMKLGMRHIELGGSILLVLSPLLNELPLMGGLSITFPDPPKLTWNWTGAAGLGITGIAGALEEVMAVNIKEIIVQAIFEQLVVPARVYVDIAELAMSRNKLNSEQRIENYRSPDPIGVLQVTILSASDLPAADFGRSSDPYVTVKIGNQRVFQTVKRLRTLKPNWGRAHCMDFLVYHMEQHLFVDVFDSDLLSKDDLLGYVCADAQLNRRPRISDLDEKQETKTWELHEGGRLTMTCRFRDFDEAPRDPPRDPPLPLLVTCDQRCRVEGLSKSSSLRACSLCGEGSVMKLMRCGSCIPASPSSSYECPVCRFRCCSRCWREKRPAAALLRVNLREGLVPMEDAKAGIILGVHVEGETQWSSHCVRPIYEDAAEQSEAKRWIRNLCSRFDRASVASCLNIPLEQIQKVLEEARETHDSENVDFLGKEPVIWDHALHFLIREPSSELKARVIYKGTRSKVEHAVLLGAGGRGGAVSEESKELTWTIPLDGPVKASVFVEVRLQALALSES